MRRVGAGCQVGQAGFVTWLYLCVNVAIFPPRSPGRVRWAGKAWCCCHLVPTFSRRAPAGTRGGPLLLPLTNLRFAHLSHEVGGGLLGPVGGCGQAPGRGPAASTAFDFHMNMKASVYITIPMPVFGGILTKWDERRQGAVGTPSLGSFVTSCLCGPAVPATPGLSSTPILGGHGLCPAGSGYAALATPLAPRSQSHGEMNKGKEGLTRWSGQARPCLA